MGMEICKSMTNNRNNWATVVNTGDSCGVPQLKRIDLKGTVWIGVGFFSIAFPSHAWDLLIQKVETERAKLESEDKK